MSDGYFESLGRKQLDEKGIEFTPGDPESFANALRQVGAPEELVRELLGMTGKELLEIAAKLKDIFESGNRPEYV